MKNPNAKSDWQDLINLTKDQEFSVSKVQLANQNISISGSFELPQLAKLSMDDQIFVMAFVRTHGSIKEMEQLFGVSYPTIKSRLNKIADCFNFEEADVKMANTDSKQEILKKLKNGEINAQEAIAALEREK